MPMFAKVLYILHFILQLISDYPIDKYNIFQKKYNIFQIAFVVLAGLTIVYYAAFVSFTFPNFLCSYKLLTLGWCMQ